MEKKEQVFLYMKEEIERLASKEEEKIFAGQGPGFGHRQ